jgi:hypothetical protein
MGNQVTYGVRAMRGLEQREDDLADRRHHGAGHDRVGHQNRAHTGRRATEHLIGEQYRQAECDDPWSDATHEVQADIDPRRYLRELVVSGPPQPVLAQSPSQFPQQPAGNGPPGKHGAEFGPGDDGLSGVLIVRASCSSSRANSIRHFQ